MANPRMIDLIYEDIILTEEEAAELKRLMDNKLCRPIPPVNTDHIINKENTHGTN